MYQYNKNIISTAWNFCWLDCRKIFVDKLSKLLINLKMHPRSGQVKAIRKIICLLSWHWINKRYFDILKVYTTNRRQNYVKERIQQ